MHSCTASFDETEPTRMTAFKARAPNGKREGNVSAKVSAAFAE